MQRDNRIKHEHMAKKVENHKSAGCKAVFMMSFIKIESVTEGRDGGAWPRGVPAEAVFSAAARVCS